MTARGVRRVVLAVCAAGIGGMIASSVADRDGAALTFGLVTAAAVTCLIVATAVAGAATTRPPATGPDDETAARVEAGVTALVAAGADEVAVRELVGEAVRLGRSARP